MKKPFITPVQFIISLFLMISISFNCWSQVGVQKQKSEFWQQVQFGGGIGLSFGSNFFSGSIAPSAIYRFDEKFAVGTSLIFSYNQEKYIYESYITGASVLGLFNPIPQLQLSAEFEQLYINRTFDDRFSNPDEKYWYPGLYLGAGFSTGPVTMGVRFDVLYDSERSIYAKAYNPFVRVYF